MLHLTFTSTALHGKFSAESADRYNCVSVNSAGGVDCRNCRLLKLSFTYSLQRSHFPVPCGSSIQQKGYYWRQTSCKGLQGRNGDLLPIGHIHPLVFRSDVHKWHLFRPLVLLNKSPIRANCRSSNVIDEDFSEQASETDEFDENTISMEDCLFPEDSQVSSVAGEEVNYIACEAASDSATERVDFSTDISQASKDAEGSISREVQVTWGQAYVLRWVRPMIRVLSGATLNQPKDIVARSRKKKDEDSWSFLKLLTGTLPPGYHRRAIGNKLRQAEADFFTFTSHLGKFLFIMMATGAILATGYQLAGGDPQEETLLWCSWLAGIIIGSMVGAGKVMEQRGRSGPRNVVITGSTRGLGKALAREFLLAGDRVVIASRSSDSVNATVEELQNEVNNRLFHPFTTVNANGGDSGSSRVEKYRVKVVGTTCDVSKVKDVQGLAQFAVRELGSIDLWINNAGVNKGFRPLVQFSDEDIQQIVSANLIGSLICTREAIRVMKSQPKGGHVFNMDGAGSGGSSTPLTAVYGSTKCGLRQLHASLLKECRRSRVGIHTASPGMVLTDLLLSGASLQNKKMFNIICELPETVAMALVPRMRDVKGSGKAINYLTPPRILLALVTAWVRRDRWFDEEGQAVYAAEADRVRNWAEGRTRFPVSAAIDQFSDTTWVSVFSITVLCAFIMLSSSGDGMPGT